MSVKEVKLLTLIIDFLLNFLIENYGIEKLSEYLKKIYKRSDGLKNLFVEVYSTDLTRFFV